MGIYAEDLLNDYGDDRDEVFQEINNLYRITIVHRKNNSRHWSNVIEASSPKDCQTIFRRDFLNIRKEYSHEYALAVQKL